MIDRYLILYDYLNSRAAHSLRIVKYFTLASHWPAFLPSLQTLCHLSYKISYRHVMFFIVLASLNWHICCVFAFNNPLLCPYELTVFA